ncbi:MAG: hypothetical protein ABJK43_17835 [Lentilitoribacter sp.]
MKKRVSGHDARLQLQNPEQEWQRFVGLGKLQSIWKAEVGFWQDTFCLAFWVEISAKPIIPVRRRLGLGEITGFHGHRQLG